MHPSRTSSKLLQTIKECLKLSKRTVSTKQVIEREEKYAAHNYHPLPVALSTGQGKTIFNIFFTLLL